MSLNKHSSAVSYRRALIEAREYRRFMAEYHRAEPDTFVSEPAPEKTAHRRFGMDHWQETQAEWLARNQGASMGQATPQGATITHYSLPVLVRPRITRAAIKRGAVASRYVCI